MNAFLFLQGSKRSLRMPRIAKRLAVAKHLEGHSLVGWVNYPGLPIASRLRPGEEVSAKAAARSWGLALRAARRGSEVHRVGQARLAPGQRRDAKTLVIHPASTRTASRRPRSFRPPASPTTTSA